LSIDCIELIALTVDDEIAPASKHRRPHPDIAVKGRALGDLINPAVNEILTTIGSRQ